MRQNCIRKIAKKCIVIKPLRQYIIKTLLYLIIKICRKFYYAYFYIKYINYICAL